MAIINFYENKKLVKTVDTTRKVIDKQPTRKEILFDKACKELSNLYDLNKSPFLI